MTTVPFSELPLGDDFKRQNQQRTPGEFNQRRSHNPNNRSPLDSEPGRPKTGDIIGELKALSSEDTQTAGNAIIKALGYASIITRASLADEEVSNELASISLPQIQSIPIELREQEKVETIEDYLRTTNMLFEMLTEAGQITKDAFSDTNTYGKIVTARARLIAHLPANLQSFSQTRQEELSPQLLKAVRYLAINAEEALEDGGLFGLSGVLLQMGTSKYSKNELVKTVIEPFFPRRSKS